MFVNNNDYLHIQSFPTYLQICSSKLSLLITIIGAHNKLPDCRSVITGYIHAWLLEYCVCRGISASVFAAPSRHCASLRECFWYILYIIVTPYYMFKLVSNDHHPAVLSVFYLTCVRLSFLESFPSKQRDETIALDGKTRRPNTCDNLTKFLSATDVACFPVGATIAPISPVSKTRWILQAKLSCLLNPAVPRQLF